MTASMETTTAEAVGTDATAEAVETQNAAVDKFAEAVKARAARTRVHAGYPKIQFLRATRDTLYILAYNARRDEGMTPEAKAEFIGAFRASHKTYAAACKKAGQPVK